MMTKMQEEVHQYDEMIEPDQTLPSARNYYRPPLPPLEVEIKTVDLEIEKILKPQAEVLEGEMTFEML